MQLPLIKPSDAKSWSLCTRRVWFDNKDNIENTTLTAFDQLVIDLGNSHERAVLERLSSQFNVQEAKSVEHTKKLMNESVDVIYQAQLYDEDENISGFPDFLLHHKNREYQPADAKLSQSKEKKEIQVQLGLYRMMLGTSLPAILYLGDGSEAEIGDETNAITFRFVTEMRDILSQEEEPAVRYSHSKCTACAYYQQCQPGFVESEELSLLYGVDGRTVPHLEAIGISTISELASADPDMIPDLPYLKDSKKNKAIMQARTWFDLKIYQIGEIQLPKGHWIHFDIEDNPLTGTGNKHVYLWGFLVPNYGDNSFEYIWTDDESQDLNGWLGFLARIEEYRARYPFLILAHYSQHERTTIKDYAKRYEMEDNGTVSYLLSDEGPLYDMRKPVVDNLVLPLQAYGLKDICKHPNLVNFQWEDEASGSQWSVVQFHKFLNESSRMKKAELKNNILGYNRDDVMATRRLEEWLRNNFELRI